MATNVSIANLALQILGVSTKIESLDADNPNAREINSCFISLREELLRKFPWNFAKKRATLPALTDQTVWGELNRYQTPTDLLRLLRPTDRHVDWELERSDTSGDVIVTRDTAPLQIRYISEVTNPAQFDSEFVQVFAARLAQQCCQPITSSAEKQQIADKAFAVALRDARMANAFERASDETITDNYLVAMGSTGPFNVIFR